MGQAGLTVVKAFHYRELFQEIYRSESVEEFETLLACWARSVMHTKLEPMKEVVKTFRKHWNGIVEWATSKLSNGILEGVNSLVQAAKARARGFRTNRFFIIMIYLITGRFDFRKLNPNCLPI